MPIILETLALESSYEKTSGRIVETHMVLDYGIVQVDVGADSIVDVRFM